MNHLELVTNMVFTQNLSPVLHLLVLVTTLNDYSLCKKHVLEYLHILYERFCVMLKINDMVVAQTWCNYCLLSVPGSVLK